MNAKKTETMDPLNYINFLNQIKEDIRQSQLKAAISITREMILLYWRTGKRISEKVSQEGWGAKTIEKIAKDITSSFPDISGFSSRNLHYMRQFAESYPNENYATAVAQIPWGHNIILLEKVDHLDKRLWYVQRTLENGWSRNMLIHWVESDLYSRQGKAITNFSNTLPESQSDLAKQILKDPYNFSFIALNEKYEEQELENALTDHIQKFLLELGKGFAFVGRQYPLEIGDKTFRIDLLFYHLKLRCYYIVELKASEFDPRDIGQMSLYLSAVDDLMRHPQDGPTIGIILCKSKNKIIAEYTIRNLNRPMGVVSYKTDLVQALPESWKESLPSVEEIEEELSNKTTLFSEKMPT